MFFCSKFWKTLNYVISSMFNAKIILLLRFFVTANSWRLNYDNCLKSWPFTCFKVATKLVAIVCLKYIYPPVYRLELKSCIFYKGYVYYIIGLCFCVFLCQNSSKEKLQYTWSTKIHLILFYLFLLFICT